MLLKEGDQVKVKNAPWVKEEFQDKVGTVQIVVTSRDKSKQWCRVFFGGGWLDYDDLSSYRLEKI